jgi:hypothetical protein
MQQDLISTIEPYKPEIEAWQAKLQYLRNENNRLKYRLSVFLSSEKTCRFVEHAESFLNRFVLQDEILAILRHEVYMHENKDESLGYEEKQRSLGREMLSVEEAFGRLNAEFQKFIEAHPKCFFPEA